MESEYREVNYKKFCETCEHKENKENEEPCAECLDHPINLYTEKPTKWEEKKK